MLSNYQTKLEKAISFIKEGEVKSDCDNFREILDSVIEYNHKKIKKLGFRITVIGRILKDTRGVHSSLFPQILEVRFKGKSNESEGVARVILNEGNRILVESDENSGNQDWRSLALVAIALLEKSLSAYKPLHTEDTPLYMEYVNQTNLIAATSSFNYTIRRYSNLHVVKNDLLIRNGLENTLFFVDKKPAEEMNRFLKDLQKIKEFSKNKYLDSGIQIELDGLLYKETLFDMIYILKTKRNLEEVTFEISSKGIRWTKYIGETATTGFFDRQDFSNQKSFTQKISFIHDSM